MFLKIGLAPTRSWLHSTNLFALYGDFGPLFFASIVVFLVRNVYTIAMKDITTKEHLLHFMQSGFMRLSKYDLKFVQNILYIITNKKEITSNQANLFIKLLSKYKKQLDKHELNIGVINSLPWNSTIKQSDPYYTSAYISVVDDLIYFRSPYNKNFIKAFRQISHNVFKWNKVEKRYEAPFSTSSLKILVTSSVQFYPVINYCPVTSKLLNTLLQYDKVTVWSPTLVKSNDNYFIGASNEIIDDAIKHISLSDNAVTLAELAQYGIKIHESITNQDNVLLFASNYITTLDFLELDKLIFFLSSIKCDAVYLDGVGMASYFKNVVKNKLASNDFKVVELYKNNILIIESTASTTQTLPDERPVLIQFTSYDKPIPYHMHKIIKMTNSTPVTIK